MATIKFEFTVSTETKTRIVDGIAYQHGYQDQVEDENGDLIDNPESRAVYAKRMAKRWIRENVKAWEVNQEAKTARIAKIEEIEAISIAD